VLARAASPRAAGGGHLRGEPRREKREVLLGRGAGGGRDRAGLLGTHRPGLRDLEARDLRAARPGEKPGAAGEPPAAAPPHSPTSRSTTTAVASPPPMQMAAQP